MKKLNGLLVLALIFLVQCSGGMSTPGSDVQAQELAGKTPSVKSAAIFNGGGDIAVDAGFASNGVTIDIPAGFTADQCKFTAAASNIDGKALSVSVSINTTTGEVICEKVVQERDEIPPEVQDCVASYTVICVQ